MADSELKTNPTSNWRVTVNGKKVDLLSHPTHKGFVMFDAPALRNAAALDAAVV